jgi:uncharacterized protein YgiB involved in biofilm formation
MTRRRSSRQITLVLIGTAALASCSQQPTTNTRDQYASLEDCAADWGRPEHCEPVRSSGVPGGFLFWGLPYAAGLRDQARTNALNDARRSGSALVDPSRQGRAIGKATVPAPTARGGFGSSSRSFSAGS